MCRHMAAVPHRRLVAASSVASRGHRSSQRATPPARGRRGCPPSRVQSCQRCQPAPSMRAVRRHPAAHNNGEMPPHGGNDALPPHGTWRHFDMAAFDFAAAMWRHVCCDGRHHGAATHRCRLGTLLEIFNCSETDRAEPSVLGVGRRVHGVGELRPPTLHKLLDARLVPSARALQAAMSGAAQAAAHHGSIRHCAATWRQVGGT